MTVGRRFLIAGIAFICLCALAVGTAWIAELRTRKQAERLLKDIRGLRVGTSTVTETEVILE